MNNPAQDVSDVILGIIPSVEVLDAIDDDERRGTRPLSVALSLSQWKHLIGLLRARELQQAQTVGEAWQKGYRAGVDDERTSEANIGIAGYGAKIEPARANPHATPQSSAPVVGDDARDAARYRWLRDVSVPPHNFYISVPVEFHDERYTPAQVDAAIDQAIESALTGKRE